MAKSSNEELKKFAGKVGANAGVAAVAGLGAMHELAQVPEYRAAGSFVKSLADVAVHHPYGAPWAAGAIGATIAAVGTMAHQRGKAVGRRAHMEEAATQARR